MEDNLIETLGDCHHTWYYIFSQDSVRADDLKNGGMSKLQKSIEEVNEGHTRDIPEVARNGEFSALSIQTRLEKACSAKGKKSVDCE